MNFQCVIPFVLLVMVFQIGSPRFVFSAEPGSSVSSSNGACSVFESPQLAEGQGAQVHSKLQVLSVSSAERWVELLQKNYAGLRTLKASFQQISYLTSLDLEETSRGEMWFQNPGKLRWEYKTPESQIFIVRGDEFELYQPLENQIIRQSVADYFSPDIPVAFLLGLGRLESRFVPTAGCERGDGVVISLNPREKQRSDEVVQAESVLIGVKKKTQLPYLFQVIDTEGNRTTLVLTDLEEDKAVSDEQFALSPSEGVDIQDLRS